MGEESWEVPEFGHSYGIPMSQTGDLKGHSLARGLVSRRVAQSQSASCQAWRDKPPPS